MSWWSYVQKHAGDDTQAVIAQRSGVTAPTVSRWSTGKQGVDPKAAAAFARAYGRPVLEAFVAAEFLTAKEAKARPAQAPDLTQLTNQQLLDLVASRMRDEGSGSGGTSITKGPWGDGGEPLSDGAHNVPDSRVAAMDDPDLLPEREAQIEDP